MKRLFAILTIILLCSSNALADRRMLFEEWRTASQFLGIGTLFTNTAGGFWSVPDNWIPSSTFPLGGSSTYQLGWTNSGSSTYVSTNNIGNPTFNLNRITFYSTSSGNTILAGSNVTITASSTNLATIRQDGSGAGYITNNIVLGSPLTVSGSGAGSLYLHGLISSSVSTGITFTNLIASVFIGGASINTFTGPVVINAPSKVIGLTGTTAKQFAGKNNLTINNGTLSNSVATAFPMGGYGNLAFVGGVTVTINSNGVYNGGGVVAYGGYAGATNNLIVNGGLVTNVSQFYVTDGSLSHNSSMVVTNGGRVFDAIGYVGPASGGAITNISAIVTGSGSKWVSSSVTYIGGTLANSRYCALYIDDHGLYTTSELNIGDAAGVSSNYIQVTRGATLEWSALHINDGTFTNHANVITNNSGIYQQYIITTGNEPSIKRGNGIGYAIYLNNGTMSYRGGASEVTRPNISEALQGVTNTAFITYFGTNNFRFAGQGQGVSATSAVPYTFKVVAGNPTNYAGLEFVDAPNTISAVVVGGAASGSILFSNATVTATNIGLSGTVPITCGATSTLVGAFTDGPMIISRGNSTNSANNLTGTAPVNTPSGVQVNDVMIAYVACFLSHTITAPAGWSNIFQNIETGNGLTQAAYYKIATNNEAGPYSFTGASPDGILASIVSYRGVDTNNVTNTWAIASASTGAADPPSITTTVDGCEIIALGSANKRFTNGGNFWTPPTGYTEITDLEHTAGQDISLAIAVGSQATAGAENPGAFGQQATDKYCAGTVAIKANSTTIAGNGGRLLKQGTGELILQGTNTYSGDTVVTNGTLCMMVTNCMASTNYYVYDGAMLCVRTNRTIPTISIINLQQTTGMMRLSNTVSQAVAVLKFAGTPQASGTWGATGSGCLNTNDTRFTGTGTLTVP